MRSIHSALVAAATAALALSSIAAQTRPPSADPAPDTAIDPAERARGKALRSEVLELMEKRIELAGAAVDSLATTLELQVSLFRAGRATEASIDDVRRAHVDAQIAVGALEFERVRLLDDIHPEATPRFDAMLALATKQERLRQELVESSQRAYDSQDALFQAGRCDVRTLTDAKRTLDEARLTRLEATQRRKRIELEQLEFRAAKPQGGGDRDAPK